MYICDAMKYLKMKLLAIAIYIIYPYYFSPSVFNVIYQCPKFETFLRHLFWFWMFNCIVLDSVMNNFLVDFDQIYLPRLIIREELKQSFIVPQQFQKSFR